MKTITLSILSVITLLASCQKKDNYICSCEYKDDVGNQYGMEKLLEDYTEKKADESCTREEESLESFRHDVNCDFYLE